jgi:hypothetical protein
MEITTLFGLRLTVTRAALAWFAGLALAMALLAWLLLALTAAEAVLAGALSAALFFVFEVLHHLGHALAARSTGYPMTGVRFFSVFAASQYPADEPALPRALHIRRALGGFWVNVLLGGLLLPAALAAWPQGGLPAWLLAYSAAANLFVLGIGSLLPIKVPGGDGLTDGGTLLKHLQQK